jgi:hypothetical protein
MTEIAIVPINNSNRDVLLEIDFSLYCDEACKYCGRIYKTVQDLCDAEVVYAGYHEHGLIACKKCWDENNE